MFGSLWKVVETGLAGELQFGQLEHVVGGIVVAVDKTAFWHLVLLAVPAVPPRVGRFDSFLAIFVLGLHESLAIHLMWQR